MILKALHSAKREDFSSANTKILLFYATNLTLDNLQGEKGETTWTTRTGQFMPTWRPPTTPHLNCSVSATITKCTGLQHNLVFQELVSAFKENAYGNYCLASELSLMLLMSKLKIKPRAKNAIRHIMQLQ